MPKNLSNFLQELAEKAGIAADDKRMIDLLSHTELNKLNLPDELVTQLQNNLLSIDDAKNNHPKIKSHYFGEIMSNVDRALTAVYKELGLEQDVIDELATESSSTKRIALLGKKLKEIHEAEIEAKGKEGAKQPKEVASLQATIDDLNKQLAAEKAARTADKTTHETAIRDFQRKTALSSRMGVLKTVYDHLPADVRNTTIEAILSKELQDNNAHFVIDENGNLQLQKKDGSNYYNEQNQLVKVDDFINATLAKTKSLVQTAPQGEQDNDGGEQQQQQNPNPNGQRPQPIVTGNKRNTALQQLVKEAEKSLNNANPVSIVTGTTN